MSTIDSSSALSLQDYFSTTLSGTISSTDTILTLASVPTASEGFLVLELGTASAEIIYYNTKGASTVTCPSVARGRAQGGTTAVAHSSGASVKQVVNADYFKELQNGNANLGMQTYFNESFFPYVQSGCVWTGDALASTRAASMTAGVVYVAGKRLVVAAVTSRTFTASKDTYIDVTTTTGSNAGTVVYTEVTNNAASPALASNSIRIGIVVTGATTIAAAGSINQGDPTCILPIASSIAYSVTDSLGNLIYNTSPSPVLIGYKQVVANQASIGAEADLTGLAVPVIVPAGRRIKVTFKGNMTDSGAIVTLTNRIKEGATVLRLGKNVNVAATNLLDATNIYFAFPTAGLHTYKMSLQSTGTGGTLEAGATEPAYLMVELV